jgi:hypothetical protein
MFKLKTNSGSLAYAPVHVTDFPVVNVHVDELSYARIWQHKLCATLSVSVNIGEIQISEGLRLVEFTIPLSVPRL